MLKEKSKALGLNKLRKAAEKEMVDSSLACYQDKHDLGKTREVFKVLRERDSLECSFELVGEKEKLAVSNFKSIYSKLKKEFSIA